MTINYRYYVELAERPAYIKTTNVNINGNASKRFFIVFRTNGCSYNLCTMCGFGQHAISPDLLQIKEEHLLRQFRYGIESAEFEKNGAIEQIDLLSLGSFLDDQEISETARIRIMRMISEMSGVRKILIESRTEFVNTSCLKILKKSLRTDQVLELAVGVESSDHHIRNTILKKGLDWQNLEKAIKVCSHNNLEFHAYLLIKPQTLSESEAIKDAANSAESIAALANRYDVPFRIAFQPVFITQNTVLENLFEAGKYDILNLWSVIEVIRRTHHIGIIFVGLNDENLSDNRRPRSCPLCTSKIRYLIEEFNAKQDISVFDSLLCVCKAGWGRKLEKQA